MALAIILMFTTSCSFVLVNVFHNEKAFLESHFEDDFVKIGEIKVPEELKEKFCFQRKFIKYHAKKINKDIVVSVYMDSDPFEDPYYESNYLFVKYEDLLEENLKKEIIKDFSNVKVDYDVQWVFSSMYETDSNVEYLPDSYEIKYEECSISIEVTEEENSDFTERLKSTVYHLYKNGYAGNKYIDVKLPDDTVKKYFVNAFNATFTEVEE